MKIVEAKIIDSAGIHARIAKKISVCANDFICETKIECDNKLGDIKSVIDLMSTSLTIKIGTIIKIVTNGTDEILANDKIIEILRDEKIIE